MLKVETESDTWAGNYEVLDMALRDTTMMFTVVLSRSFKLYIDR